MKRIKTSLKKHAKHIWFFNGILLAWFFVVSVIGNNPVVIDEVRVENSNYASVDLTWDKSDDARAYRIYRSKDNTDYDYIGSSVSNRFTDSNLRTGDTYFYKIVSRNGFRTSDIQSTESVKIVPQLETPSLDVDISEGEMKLSISSVEGASGYEIMRDGVSIDKTENNQYIDENIKDGKEHSYSVKAFRYEDNPVYSEESNDVDATIHKLHNLEAVANKEEIQLTWDESDHYKSYKLYKDDELLSETTETKYTIEGYEQDKVYKLKVVGVSEDDVLSPDAEKNFVIQEEPMDNEAALDAVCQWAVEIAEDDTFHYGNGAAAHHNGCYFCGTQALSGKRSKKGVVQYQKTYCCNPFIQAAFAHGCNDPTMLAVCKKGSSYVEKHYRSSSLFENLGKPSRDSLKKGDVLCCRNGHVMLYIGDGQLVEAANGDDGKVGSTRWNNSISVGNLTDGRWNSKSYGVTCAFRYKGAGSGSMYVVKDVDEKGNVKEEKKEEPTESEQA